MKEQVAVGEEVEGTISTIVNGISYRDILHSYFPDGFEKRRNSLVYGSSIEGDHSNEVTYLNVKQFGNIGYQARRDLSKLLQKATFNNNIVAKYNPQTKRFTSIENGDNLISRLIGDGDVIMGAAGPDVRNYGYMVLEYIIMMPHTNGLQ